MTDNAPRNKNEEEYFKRQDAELMERMRAQLDAERLKQERSAHYMKCPKCGADLTERELDRVKVDVCPECNGVWFDAGEIEMLRHIRQREGAITQVVTDFLGMFRTSK